jgi:hypothetical protein
MRSVKESTLRARARKLGYTIHKSRSRTIHEDNLGRYALVKEDSNRVVLGERFDASLEEIAEYLDWDAEGGLAILNAYLRSMLKTFDFWFLYPQLRHQSSIRP